MSVPKRGTGINGTAIGNHSCGAWPPEAGRHPGRLRVRRHRPRGTRQRPW